MRALEAVAGWRDRYGVGAAAAVLGPATGPPPPGNDPGPPPVHALGGSGDPHRVYPWASVTKLCTTLAILVATEEGTVALEDPCGPPGATVAHLLAHASGLAPDRPEALSAPGTRRIYSNAGFELLGAHLGERSGLGFATYLREAVLEPLGMHGAALEGGASPAHGLAGSLGDLAAVAAELLAPTLVDPATVRRATEVAFPGLDGVLPGFGRHSPCDWGLGPEVRGHKSPHWTGARNSPRTFGHFGQAGGFVWVDPLVGVACAVLSDLAFGPWAAEAWPQLADAVLAEVAPGAPSAPGAKESAVQGDHGLGR